MAEIFTGRPLNYSVTVLKKTCITGQVMELTCTRPDGFSFRAGQKVLLQKDGCSREYTLAGGPCGDLVFCIKLVPGGKMSELLSLLAVGDFLTMSDAYGFFVHRPGSSVFIATGTGVAPFVAYALSGVTDYIILHGVKAEAELYYRDVLENGARKYVACLSSADKNVQKPDCLFQGRVTLYLKTCLPYANYDFYLCGNGDMIRESLHIIDNKFPESKVFTEIYFQ